MMLADARYALGDGAGSLAAYEKAFKILRDLPEAAYARAGNLLISGGDFGGAVRVFSAGTSKFGRSTILRYGLASAFCRKGEAEKSAIELSRAIEIDGAAARSAEADGNFIPCMETPAFRRLVPGK